jgi:uncharacterized membrane protein (DUF106 family)
MAFGLPGYIEVLLISLALSLGSVLVYRFSTNQEAIRGLKKEMKTLNDRVKKARESGNMGEMNKLSGELMKLSSRQFQMNMKPMMLSLLIFVGVFWVFGTYYSELIIPSPVSIPFVGNELGWYYWYFLIVLPGSFIFRKLLAVE